MIKKIKAKQLIEGMYIHKLNCSWLYHPFAQNQFKITNHKEIKKIFSAGILVLEIDTDKGLDVPVKNVEKEVNPSPVNNKFLKKTRLKTRQEAKKIKKQAQSVICTIMHNVKLGQQVEIELVTPIVDKMANSILENQNTLLSLSRIRNMDEYTFEHSVNIGILMMSFAKTRKMPFKVIQEVGIGGLLHDIGKSLTPPEILNKPGKLSDEEFVIMRHHVVESKNILEKTPGICKNAMDVAILHHEKFDGTGYPEGKKGNEISEVGQMSAIVDVYDALTAERCYHKGQEPSVVLKRMLSWSNSHFNSKLMQEFIHCIGIYPTGSLVMLNNQHLAAVIENGSNLLAPKIVIFLNTKNRETVIPQFIDLSKQDKLKVISSESEQLWNVNLQKYLDLG